MQIEISEETKTRVSVLLSEVPRGPEKAFTGAINRALTRARTVIFQEVQGTYAIKKKVLDEFTKTDLQKASTSDVCGVIRFAGTQIPLYKYNLTNPKYPIQGMKVKAGQKTATTFERAFIAKMKSGHLGIFERNTKESLPIKEIMGSSMQTMAGNEKTMEKTSEEANKVLDARLEHEIHRLLNGYGGK